jgi:hypothetical protein
VPFCGDGDIAQALYRDRTIFAADLDPKRVATAQKRLPQATVIKADCDRWPFPGERTAFAVADFDAYSNPWPAFDAFWREAKKVRRVVLFFTESGMKFFMLDPALGGGRFSGRIVSDINERRRIFNFYPSTHLLPQIKKTVSPWSLTGVSFYVRNKTYYIGAMVEP